MNTASYVTSDPVEGKRTGFLPSRWLLGTTTVGKVQWRRHRRRQGQLLLLLDPGPWREITATLVLKLIGKYIYQEVLAV